MSYGCYSCKNMTMSAICENCGRPTDPRLNAMLVKVENERDASMARVAGMEKVIGILDKDCADLRARCEAAERERDAAQARVAELVGLLRETKSILSLCDQKRAGCVHDHMDMQASACGERDGYGAWMDALQRMWELRDAVGCFTVGPCLGTVRHLDKLITTAIGDKP